MHSPVGRRSPALVALAVTTLGALGCGKVRELSDAPPSTSDQADAAGSTAPTTMTQVIPSSVDIDLLFIVDNSPSTSDKQAVFVANFPTFVQALDSFPTGRPNVHIGVVSTSVDIQHSTFGPACPTPNTTDDGRLQNTARVTNCTPPTDRYLSDVSDGNGGRTLNYTGALGDAFSCIADLGTTGCGFEAPLEAMKKALDGSLSENAGFLRPGAFLAVIVLTDEDDCSVKDYSLFDLDATAAGPGDFRCQPLYAYDCDHPIGVAGPDSFTNCKVKTGSYLQDTTVYHDFLTGLKSPGQIMVAVIGGDPTSNVAMTGALTMPFVQSLTLMPSCTATINGNYAIGRPGIRLNDFVQQFGTQGIYDSVCQPSYTSALAAIGTQLAKDVSPCLAANVDTTDHETSNPGLQPACTVNDVVGIGTAGAQSTDVPACPMSDASTPAPGGPRPCWWLKQDTTLCTAAPNLALQVERAQPPAPGLDVQVTCQTH